MPKNQITRPTLSKVREAIFNILGNDLTGMVFWDLFAGSGAIGLSALSLGAQTVAFVEQDLAAVQALKKNIEEAKKRFLNSEGLDISPLLFSSDLKRAWKSLISTSPPDIIWADPPYAESPLWSSYLKKELLSLVKTGTLLIMELQSEALKHAEKEGLLTDLQWELIKTRTYGNSSLVIWRKA